jgi:predicted transcriptional regulator
MEQTPQKVATTVTLPPDLRTQLDTEAARQDRSRSWITAEAIKEYLANREVIRSDR